MEAIGTKALGGNQMSNEWMLDHIRMLANVLVDVDEIHEDGNMDARTFGAIVNLVALRLQQVAGVSTANED